MLLSNLDLLATAPGGVARLRELILTLAVQGKLVPQDPADEPASLLLQKIRVEKDRLIAEGKIKRDKPLAAIADEEKAFELPVGWCWARIAELGEVVGGGTPKSDEPKYWASKDIPWLTPADLYGRREVTIAAGRRDISAEGLTSSSARLMPAGTVLFSSRAPIGYVAIAANSLATNQGFKSCVPHVEGLSHYLYWHLKQLARKIDSEASGTTFKEISGKDFANVVLSVPPLPEQSRIVTRVEELMRLCDALEVKVRLEATQHAQLVSTLLGTLTACTTPEELADHWQRVAQHFDLLLDRPMAVDALEQTLVQLAVRGLLVPQDPADEPASALLPRIRAEKDRLIAEGKIKCGKPLLPITDEEKSFELPAGWAWVKLENLASQITDGAHHTPIYLPEGVPFLSVKDLSSGAIDFSDTRFISERAHQDLAKRCHPELGDVLLTKIGTTGIAVLVDTQQEFSIFVSVALIKLPSVSVNKEFLCLVINSPFVRQQSEDGTEGVGNKNLVLRKIKAFHIPIPPLTEQSRIVTRVTALRHLCADLRQQLADAQNTQSRLAQALVDSTSSL